MKVGKRIKSWLVFSRAHTVILEAPMAALGAALGVGGFWNIEVLKWALFGALYHIVGYSMNSYADWKNGYDKEDPNKEHHPLNTGAISGSAAKTAVICMTNVLLVYGIILTKLKLEALVVLALMVLVGVSYNYFGKVIQHKYILVAIVHTLVFLLPYYSYSSKYSNIIWIGVLAYFVHHVFQILISGDVKDIEMDESSLVQELGMGIEYVNNKKVLDVNPNVIAISYIITIIEGVIAFGILLYFNPADYVYILCIVLFGWMLVELDGIIAEGVYDRESRVAAMSRKELAGLWMIFASFISEIGVEAFAVMVIGSLAYFFPISYFMWGGISPDV